MITNAMLPDDGTIVFFDTESENLLLDIFKRPIFYAKHGSFYSSFKKKKMLQVYESCIIFFYTDTTFTRIFFILFRLLHATYDINR